MAKASRRMKGLQSRRDKAVPDLELPRMLVLRLEHMKITHVVLDPAYDMGSK